MYWRDVGYTIEHISVFTTEVTEDTETDRDVKKKVRLPSQRGLFAEWARRLGAPARISFF